MMTKQINFVAPIALTLGLLIVASPAYSCPIQDSITLRAIGVGPIQPQPVQEASPAPQEGTIIRPNAAIGVSPVAIGVDPVPQPQPQPQSLGPVIIPGDYVPVQPVPVNPFPQPVPQVIPHQQGPVVVHPGGQQAARAVIDSRDFTDQRALAGLQNFLNQQAALGQYPHNNKVLADLSAVIAKHSQTASSKVSVVNSGPGTLRVTHGNGTTTDVRPNFSLEIHVKSGKVHLSAQFQNALITLANVSGSQAKFWDQDDLRHTSLGTDRFGINQQHHFTLTPGVWGHYLTQ